MDKFICRFTAEEQEKAEGIRQNQDVPTMQNAFAWNEVAFRALYLLPRKTTPQNSLWGTLRIQSSEALGTKLRNKGAVDFRHLFAQPVPMEQPNGAPGKVIYLGACLIAAVRLAREENWNNSPRVISRISDAISLAKRIYDRMKVDYPALR
jgi:hypothetical protein